MCQYHTQTRALHCTHSYAYIHLYLLRLCPPRSTFSDPSACRSSILHTQHFPVLPLQSMCMSYEGNREDGGLRVWVCLCLSVWGIKGDTLSLAHVSADEYLWSPVLQEDVGLLLFCICKMQIGLQSCSVWSLWNPCVKHMPVRSCLCVAHSKCYKCA